jgi:hypothetical protein
MGSVNINGRIFSGKSVIVKNGKVFVDGNSVAADEKEIKIEVTGNIETLTVDYCKDLKVTGDVSKVKTMSGDVTIGGEVKGDVRTMSGDVRCGNIAGKVKTMSGNIKNK